MTPAEHPADPLARRYGPATLPLPVRVPAASFRLILRGIETLWQRIVADDPGAEDRPLLLSYDVHPGPDGPVLIEVNTNAGGILSAIQAARLGNPCCADWEQGELEDRLIALFRRDLLGLEPAATGVVAIVDDELDKQALRPEMEALCQLLRPWASDMRLVDASTLRFEQGLLHDGNTVIDRIYWRSTDFRIEHPGHRAVRQALDAGRVILAPSPAAYTAIADKRRFIDWSRQPMLAQDGQQQFRIARTLPMRERSQDQWYAERADWVFKPSCGHASRGVYLGRKISRAKLASLPAAQYLAQQYAAHPQLWREGEPWKYDLRLFADRGQVIGAAARVFQGQVLGLRAPGSGFAPVVVDESCCLIRALQGR